jgi:hypothetical protein
VSFVTCVACVDTKAQFASAPRIIAMGWELIHFVGDKRLFSSGNSGFVPILKAFSGQNFVFDSQNFTIALQNFTIALQNFTIALQNFTIALPIFTIDSQIFTIALQKIAFDSRRIVFDFPKTASRGRDSGAISRQMPSPYLGSGRCWAR